MSEVRGSSHECQAATVKKWQKVATPHPRSGVAARRNYAVSEVRGRSGEEQTHVQGAVAAWMQEGLDELFHVQGQEGHW